MTMRALARLAELDTSTVSRALNGDTTRVSAAAIARVRALADEHGYRPDAVAAALRRGRSRIIGVLVPPSPTSSWPRSSTRSTAPRPTPATRRRDLDPRLPRPAQRRRRRLRRPRVDGVVIADAVAPVAAPRALRDSGIPFVIALRTTRGRLAGFADTLDAAGVPIDPHLAHHPFGVREGHEAMSAVLAAGRRPTAVFAMNDHNAIGAGRALHEHGLRIGRDVALVGYNDIAVGSHLTVSLTSVRNELDAIGAGAARMVIDLIAGLEADSLVLPPRLVVRESSAGTAALASAVRPVDEHPR